MELWDFHPVFVHFTVGLLFTGSALFIATAMGRRHAWAANGLIASRWIFWSGIIALLITAVTGLLAYFTVPGIPPEVRGDINKHFAAAVVTAVTYLVLAFFLWRRQRLRLPPSGAWTGMIAVGMALLLVTGYLGGHLVFDKGVGVATAVPAAVTE
jgi:uncharacterized membrane protein